jgi:ketosteroid isomerase-like protein
MNTKVIGTLLRTSLLVAAVLAATPTFAEQPGPELVQAGVDAYNNRDLAYFEEHLADDVVWLDEDGHIMNGKSTVLGFIRLQFNQSPAPMLSVSNVRVGSTTDAAWATFAYMLMGGEEHIMGLNTTVFKRIGNDWQIAVVHGAFNASGHH